MAYMEENKMKNIITGFLFGVGIGLVSGIAVIVYQMGLEMSLGT